MAPTTKIRSFDDLCATLEVKGLDGFEEWLEMVHDEPEWSVCDTDYSELGLQSRISHSGIQDVDFELSFPCTLDDVWSAVIKLEETVVRHQNVLYTDVELFGDPGDEEDRTAEIAGVLYVSETDLVQAVGGRWELTDGPACGSDVKPVYHWFGRGDPHTVLLGLGGDAVYIASVWYGLDGSACVDDWPDPVAENRQFAESEGRSLSEAQFLERLRDDLAAAEEDAAATEPPGPTGTRRNASDTSPTSTRGGMTHG